MPDGQKYIEGKTPLQIAPSASHGLPDSESIEIETKDIKDLDG